MSYFRHFPLSECSKIDLAGRTFQAPALFHIIIIDIKEWASLCNQLHFEAHGWAQESWQLPAKLRYASYAPSRKAENAAYSKLFVIQLTPRANKHSSPCYQTEMFMPANNVLYAVARTGVQCGTRPGVPLIWLTVICHCMGLLDTPLIY